MKYTYNSTTLKKLNPQHPLAQKTVFEGIQDLKKLHEQLPDAIKNELKPILIQIDSGDYDSFAQNTKAYFDNIKNRLDMSPDLKEKILALELYINGSIQTLIKDIARNAPQLKVPDLKFTGQVQLEEGLTRFDSTQEQAAKQAEVAEVLKEFMTQDPPLTLAQLQNIGSSQGLFAPMAEFSMQSLQYKNQACFFLEPIKKMQFERKGDLCIFSYQAEYDKIYVGSSVYINDGKRSALQQQKPENTSNSQKTLLRVSAQIIFKPNGSSEATFNVEPHNDIKNIDPYRERKLFVPVLVSNIKLNKKKIKEEIIACERYISILNGDGAVALLNDKNTKDFSVRNALVKLKLSLRKIDNMIEANEKLDPKSKYLIPEDVSLAILDAKTKLDDIQKAVSEAKSPSPPKEILTSQILPGPPLEPPPPSGEEVLSSYEAERSKNGPLPGPPSEPPPPEQGYHPTDDIGNKVVNFFKAMMAPFYALIKAIVNLFLKLRDIASVNEKSVIKREKHTRTDEIVILPQLEENKRKIMDSSREITRLYPILDPNNKNKDKIKILTEQIYILITENQTLDPQYKIEKETEQALQTALGQQRNEKISENLAPPPGLDPPLPPPPIANSYSKLRSSPTIKTTKDEREDRENGLNHERNGPGKK